MEEDCEVFIDPDEDEIFFGKITDMEVNVSSKIKSSESTLQCEKADVLDALVKAEKSNKNHTDISSDLLDKHDEVKQNIQKVNTGEKNSNGTHEKRLQEKDDVQIKQEINCEKPEIKIDPCVETLCHGILENIIDNISSRKTSADLSSTPQMKMEDTKMFPNVQLDHNYSTPVKSIIDKSILSTPKSIVKADKDGGFLKVLSEIALVKAEADIERSLNKEDEDKENKNVNISLKIPEVKVTEATPDKSVQSPSPKKLNKDIRKFRLVYNTPEKHELTAADNMKATTMITLPKTEKTIKSSDIKSQSLINLESLKDVKSKVEDEEFLKKNLGELEKEMKKMKEDTVKSLPVEIECTGNSLSKSSLKNKLTDKCKADSPAIVKLMDSSYENVDNTNSEEKRLLDGELDNEKANIENLLITSVRKDEKPCEEVNTSSNSDIQILENTLEEKTVDEKLSNIRMSEEARKVVEVLLNKAEDESFNLTIQEIDVDKTHIPFASPEVSDFLNDSLSKPTSNSRTELLRELLSATPKDKICVSPFRTPISPQVPSAKKVFASEEKLKQQATPLIPKKTPMSKITANKINSVTKTTEKEKNFTPLLLGKKTPASAVTARWPTGSSGNVTKCVKRLNVDEVTSKADDTKKDLLTKGKGLGSSNIPKFGKVSKIPVSGKKIVFHPTNKTTPAKTFGVKTPKSAAYSKIESPVNAYINNRPTPLIKNIKPEIKKDSAKKVWIRQAAGSAKKLKNEEQIQKFEPVRCKMALPYIEYRSATPLKLEKPIESKLPRLAPTMKKLITANSPTVLKHEGRIHLNLPRKVPINVTDSSIMVDPNEVSVVLSHTAQKSNTISK